MKQVPCSEESWRSPQDEFLLTHGPVCILSRPLELVFTAFFDQLLLFYHHWHLYCCAQVRSRGGPRGEGHCVLTSSSHAIKVSTAVLAGAQSCRAPEEKDVLIFDLGGGTFDAPLLAVEGGIFGSGLRQTCREGTPSGRPASQRSH